MKKITALVASVMLAGSLLVATPAVAAPVASTPAVSPFAPGAGAQVASYNRWGYKRVHFTAYGMKYYCPAWYVGAFSWNPSMMAAERCYGWTGYGGRF